MIRILIPLDGSNAAEEALNHALAIAKTFPAELLLLRVVTESNDSPPAHVDCVDFALWRHQAQAYLDSLARKYATREMPISCEVAEGNPAESVVQCISRTNPDLLILTRYGFGNARDFATGGTAQKILSGCECSVILLDPRFPLGPEQTYHRILVLIDDTKDSECALAIATMIAEIHGASILLLQAIEEPRLPMSFPATVHARQLINEMRRIIQDEAQRRLHCMMTRLPRHLKVDTRTLLSSEPSLAIESMAEEDTSDLILLHNGNSGFSPSKRLSTINQSLIQYSHRPLFIFRPDVGDGFASNFRSVYSNEPRREAG